MRDKLWKKGLVFGIIVLFVGAGVIPSIGGAIVERRCLKDNKTSFMPFNPRGNILYVGGDGPGNYTNIQDAMDEATDGDTVFVYDDSSPYYENVVVNKSINLIGEDKNNTIIDAKGNGDIISITANGVNISGFNITNGVDGIFLNNCINVIVKGNIISYCQDGIELFFSNCNNIKENIIKKTDGTLSEFKVGGIDLNSSNENNISHNIIQDNIGVAICLFRSTHNIVYSNSIERNEFCGVYIEENSNNNKVIKNNFIDNKKYDGHFWLRSNRNEWDSNYWDKWIGHKSPFFNKFPKLIIGWWFRFIPWINIDWHPAAKPYDIP